MQKTKDYIATQYDYKIKLPKDKNYLQINWENPEFEILKEKREVKICNRPFAIGESRYSFYMVDPKNQKPVNLVAKLPKYLDESKYDLENLRSTLDNFIYASFMVNEFNEKIKDIVKDNRLLLKVILSQIYEINVNETPKMKYKIPYKYYCTEEFIEGKYNKFGVDNNLLGKVVGESIMITEAFSHFSWQVSNGYLVVMDSEAITGLLTKPQIHCLNSNKFGKNNKGYEGILRFFLSHSCNKYCQHLNLIKLKEAIDADKIKKNYSEIRSKHCSIY